MAGGDYNSKHTVWGSRITTTKGRELFNLLHKQNYSFLSTTHPTYWPSNPAKELDLLYIFVTNGISATYTAIEPSYDLSSDHSPVIATTSTSRICLRSTPDYTCPGPTGAPTDLSISIMPSNTTLYQV
jgi:endonuclease/exonuclease/phosphatase (EEP) superfamily protein YafD